MQSWPPVEIFRNFRSSVQLNKPIKDPLPWISISMTMDLKEECRKNFRVAYLKETEDYREAHSDQWERREMRSAVFASSTWTGPRIYYLTSDQWFYMFRSVCPSYWQYGYRQIEWLGYVHYCMYVYTLAILRRSIILKQFTQTKRRIELEGKKTLNIRCLANLNGKKTSLNIPTYLYNQPKSKASKKAFSTVLFYQI